MKVVILKYIGVIFFISLTVSNGYAEKWIDIVTLSDQRIYQIAPTTMATTEFGEDLYIVIDGRYLSNRGNDPRLETVAVPESACKLSSGTILIKREGEREVQVQFNASVENLPFRITQVICRTYGRIKNILNN